jgi:hypothetical protein
MDFMFSDLHKKISLAATCNGEGSSWRFKS